ncbi:uncharacterized protein Pelo_17897 [Pelomyxa schiedti]|nr:uncharacterized protein Pelo_17897 [Pelomyxa schiedti]
MSGNDVGCVEREIGSKLLTDIEGANDVDIFFAALYGSRAWGIESPDSDYDVRFLYVHRLRWYLGVTPRKTTIEVSTTVGKVPVELSGWDIQKAVELCGKSNASLLEWLHSPVTFRNTSSTTSPDFVSQLRQLALSTAVPRAVGWHYHNNAKNDVEACLMKHEPVRKSYLYVIRPVACMRWIMDNPDIGLPPLALDELLGHIHISPEVAQTTKELIAQKRAGVLAHNSDDHLIHVDEWLRVSMEEWRAKETGTGGKAKGVEPPWSQLNQLVSDIILFYESKHL